MKLEIKHLSAYLPYGIKMKYCIENGCIWELDINNINAITEYDKPILRPLSDLYQDGEINTPDYLQGCCYSYVQHLISQHYDVFGLIEKGLAININTL